MRLAGGDNAIGMIQGGLVGSVWSVVSTTCRLLWPVVQVWPGRSDRARSVGGAITRLGKRQPMLSEESDGS